MHRSCSDINVGNAGCRSACLLCKQLCRSRHLHLPIPHNQRTDCHCGDPADEWFAFLHGRNEIFLWTLNQTQLYNFIKVIYPRLCFKKMRLSFIFLSIFLLNHTAVSMPVHLWMGKGKHVQQNSTLACDSKHAYYWNTCVYWTVGRS